MHAHWALFTRFLVKDLLTSEHSIHMTLSARALDVCQHIAALVEVVAGAHGRELGVMVVPEAIGAMAFVEPSPA